MIINNYHLIAAIAINALQSTMITRTDPDLKLAPHCEEGFKQLVELLLVRLSPNVLVHLDDHDDDYDDYEFDYDYDDDDDDLMTMVTFCVPIPLVAKFTK